MSNPLAMRYLDMLIPQEPQAQDSWTWATVTAIGPLKIRLDGETAPLAGTPETLMKDLAVNDRVWVQLYGRRAIIHGGSSRSGAGSIFGGDTGWHHFDYAGEPVKNVPGYLDNGGSWSMGRFRRDASGNVWLGGLLQPSTNGQVLFTLPKGFRPANRGVYQCVAGNNQGLIEVLNTGEVILNNGGNNFINLEEVHFPADGDDPLMQASWVDLPLKNGWLNKVDVRHANFGYLVDSVGDVHFRGQISGGQATDLCDPLPASVRPKTGHIFTMPAQGGAYRTDIDSGGNISVSEKSASASNAWIAFEGMVLANTGGKHPWPYKPGLTNGWQQYDPNGDTTGWSSLRWCYNRNGVVSLWGMIYAGNLGTIVGGASPYQGGIPPASRSDHQEIHLAATAGGGWLRWDLGAEGSLSAVAYALGGNNGWVGIRGRWFAVGK